MNGRNNKTGQNKIKGKRKCITKVNYVFKSKAYKFI